MEVVEVPPEMEHRRAEFASDSVERLRTQFYGASSFTIAEGVESITAESEEGADAYFVDVDQQMRITQIKQFGRVFLFEEPIRNYGWRLTGDVTTFLGHEVHKALAETEEGVVEAWFTPDIPAPVGPRGYSGLPGLILLVTEGGGKRTYAAKAVDPTPIASALIAPRDGMLVTTEEYNRLVEERLEAMMQMMKSMGVTPTVIRNN